MANIYLKKNFYDEIIKRGEDPTKVVNDLVEKWLEEVE